MATRPKGKLILIFADGNTLETEIPIYMHEDYDKAMLDAAKAITNNGFFYKHETKRLFYPAHVIHGFMWDDELKG